MGKSGDVSVVGEYLTMLPSGEATDILKNAIETYAEYSKFEQQELTKRQEADNQLKLAIHAIDKETKIKIAALEKERQENLAKIIGDTKLKMEVLSGLNSLISVAAQDHNMQGLEEFTSIYKQIIAGQVSVIPLEPKRDV